MTPSGPSCKSNHSKLARSLAPRPNADTPSSSSSSSYDIVVSIIGDLLVSKSVESFNKQATSDFPDDLIQELHGIVDGAQAANPSTKVSWDRIVTLNYGMDWLSAQVFGGKLVDQVRQFAVKLAVSSDPRVSLLDLPLIAMLTDEDLTVPVHCDAFAGTRINPHTSTHRVEYIPMRHPSPLLPNCCTSIGQGHSVGA